MGLTFIIHISFNELHMVIDLCKTKPDTHYKDNNLYPNNDRFILVENKTQQKSISGGEDKCLLFMAASAVFMTFQNNDQAQEVDLIKVVCTNCATMLNNS